MELWILTLVRSHQKPIQQMDQKFLMASLKTVTQSYSGDEDNPYNIWIGGGGPNAMDFSVSNGGYRAEPEKGTNFYPTTIIGFRTGQGVPALTVFCTPTPRVFLSRRFCNNKRFPMATNRSPSGALQNSTTVPPVWLPPTQLSITMVNYCSCRQMGLLVWKPSRVLSTCLPSNLFLAQ